MSAPDTRVVIGVELDSDTAIKGLSHRLQFVQWTLASTPNHSLIAMVVERVMTRLKQAPIDILQTANEAELEVTPFLLHPHEPLL